MEKSETIEARGGKLVYNTMSSWNLNSYRAALVKQDGSASELLNPSLFPRKRDSDGRFLAAAAVNAKYYYAGGSARWMFAYSTERIQLDVEMYLCESGDYRSLVDFRVGARSSATKNHVYSCFETDGRNSS
jgi:hypothetical protein